MKKLIYIKLAKDLTIFFILSLILLGLIVWILQAVNYFDLVAEDGHGIKIYFLFTFFNMPKILHRILPFVYFISIFYLIVSYEAKNEFNILWINGVSKIKLVNKIILFSLILMVLQIINGSIISPKFQYKGRLLLKNSNMDFFSSLLKEGKFINTVSGLTIFISKKNKDNSFKDIYLDDSTKDISKIIYAKKGYLIKNNQQNFLKLFNGQVINKKENGKINTFEFDQIDFNLNEYSTKSIIKPKIQEKNTLSLLSCFYPNFLLLKNFKIICENKTLNVIKQELIKRLFKPIYIPIITIFVCFLFVTSRIKNNYSKIRNIVFLMGILIIIFSEISLRYSVTSIYNFNFFLIFPFIIFLISYLFFLNLTKNV